MVMDCIHSMESRTSESPYELLFMVAISIPVPHYLLGLILVLLLFLYNFLKMHCIQNLLSGFQGQPVTLTFNPSSKLYHDVVSKCRILHGRYLSTSWFSPHLQTVFLSRYGGGPHVNYRRHIFKAADGGTVALDWAINHSDDNGKKPAMQVNDDRNPITIIIPGLTSDSNSSYIKHLVLTMAKHGRKAVVINHRGLGGVSLTSDWFYFGGWTGDMRAVIKDLHCKYPEAPLFLVGTSIGANMMVFYLGEDGIDVPLTGAAAICCPWDPLLCDRFLSRNFIQKIYSKALATSLKGYAHMHKTVISRISNWEGIEKSYYCRDFDNSAFRLQANLETVDTYYRVGCSTKHLGKVKVPLLCISSLDDPICTKEAIPWDECRLNDNIVLATTEHGGHLSYFEGLRGKSVWWVRAVDEFFSVLQCNPMSIRKKEMAVYSVNALDSSIDSAPILNITNELADAAQNLETKDVIRAQGNAQEPHCASLTDYPTQILDTCRSKEQRTSQIVVSRKQKSFWVLAISAMNTSWPFVGLAFALFFMKKYQK